MSIQWKKKVTLVHRFGRLLIGLLVFQSIITLMVSSIWINKGSHEMDQAVLIEQGRFLMPALEDSLAQWEGQGPRFSWPSQIRYYMQHSLGDLENLGLAWVDAHGNRAVVGLLQKDPLQGRLLDALEAGDLEALGQLAEQSHYPWLSSTSDAGRLLLVRRSHPNTLWHEKSALLAGILLFASAVAFLTTWFLSRPLIQRFVQFQKAFRALGHGELGHDLIDENRDELADLATEFNLMRERMNKLDLELSESNQRRRQLLSEVSHELGAPLTTVQGHLEILLSRDLPEADRAHLRIARQQAKRMDELSSDLLQLSKLEDTKRERTQHPFDLNRVLQDEVAAIELVCLERDIQIQFKVTHEPIHALGDAKRSAQILRNLLRNAIQHLAQNSLCAPLLSIDLEPRDSAFTCQPTTSDTEELLISICDNGSGIEESALPHIFDRYYRQSDNCAQGSGLGLTISKALAEEQGGTLTAHSDGLGKGATFHLRLKSPA
jgi:signal transduction histidine kinase